MPQAAYDSADLLCTAQECEERFRRQHFELVVGPMCKEAAEEAEALKTDFRFF